jgi:hypothetical protein
MIPEQPVRETAPGKERPIAERPPRKKDVKHRLTVREHMLKIINAFQMERRPLTRVDLADLNETFLTAYSAKNTTSYTAFERLKALSIISNARNNYNGGVLKLSWIMQKPKEEIDNIMCNIGSDGFTIRKVGHEQLSSPIEIVREAAQREVEVEQPMPQPSHSMEDSIQKAAKRKNILERFEMLEIEVRSLKEMLRIML